MSILEYRPGHVGALLKPKGHYRPLPEDMHDPTIRTYHPNANLKIIESFADDSAIKTRTSRSFPRYSTVNTSSVLTADGVNPRTGKAFAKGSHVVPPNRIQEVQRFHKSRKFGGIFSKKQYGTFEEEPTETHLQVEAIPNGNPLVAEMQFQQPYAIRAPIEYDRANPLAATFTPNLAYAAENPIVADPVITPLEIATDHVPRRSNYYDFFHV